MNYTSFVLTCTLSYINQRLDDIAHNLILNISQSETLLNEYDRLSYLRDKYIKAIEHRWEDFDWLRANDEGWLCENDYKIFAKELNGLTYEEGVKRFNEHHAKRSQKTE